MKTTKILGGVIFLAIAGFSQISVAASSGPLFPECSSLPGTSNSIHGGCNALVTNTNNGISIAIDPLASGFGGEDSYIAVTNNSSTALYSFILSSTADIFGFDYDGTLRNGSYAGAGITFTGINNTYTSGTVNFAGGLAAGSSIAFELEENLSAKNLPPPVVVATVPEPTTVALLGLGIFGFAVSRRKSAKNKNV